MSMKCRLKNTTDRISNLLKNKYFLLQNWRDSLFQLNNKPGGNGISNPGRIGDGMLFVTPYKHFVYHTNHFT